MTYFRRGTQDPFRVRETCEWIGNKQTNKTKMNITGNQIVSRENERICLIPRGLLTLEFCVVGEYDFLVDDSFLESKFIK